MRKESLNNVKKSNPINLTHKTTKLNIDLTSVLIDKTLQESASIMYIRQATYYFLLKLNGWTRSDLHKEVKQRSQVLNIPYNKGVIVKESAVALYALDNLTSLFNKVTINKKNFESCIDKIALIMQKNKIAYNYLKDKLQNKNPKESAESQKVDSQESAESQKVEIKEVDFESVVTFIKTTTQENRLKLCDILDSAIRAAVDKKQKSKKAA